MASNSPSSQHNSTLTISPLLINRRRDLFYVTPPTNVNDGTGAGNNDGSLSNVNAKKSSNLNSSKIFTSSTPASSSKLSRVAYNNSVGGEEEDEEDDDDEVDVGGDTRRARDEEKEQIPLSQADKLRLWRHDALMQHHYKTAEYIGDKVLALTNDPNDAFWLAQVHYTSGNYTRARKLLSGKREFDESVSCRYLKALCLTKLEKWDEALDIIGEINPFKNEQFVKNQDGGIKLEASMCYLRGLIYANQNNFDRAEECYKEAVLVDVKCFEAFDELIKNNLMTPKEEWELLSMLNFDDADNNNELVKLLYTTRLNKYINIKAYEEADSRLKEEYTLGENSDILLSRADLLFVQCRFQQCLEICEKILEKDEFNFTVLPNYLSCLHELGGKNKLFLVAHRLAENHPNNHVTWLAVGIYYLSINRISEARRFFSKASLLNPNFGQAWIGFAHTFAAEGEHEQAISAYATASRLFPGTHLPNLFLGMQYLQMNNITLAEEYLNYSYSICPTDPLLLNEMGVIQYHKNNLNQAEQFFQDALERAKDLNSDSKAWLSIHANLGHVYRRLRLYDKSLQSFNQVLKISSKDSNIYSAIGLVHLKRNEINKAIETLHVALSIQPNDPVATDLLKKALEENISSERNEEFLLKSEEAVSRYFKNSSLFKTKSVKSNQLVNTPINRMKNFNLNNKSTGGNNSNNLDVKVTSDIDFIVNDLKRGEDSSDDDGDDGEVMVIESD
ncbi:hypothetical protein PACTADRAFT_80161 [Pachysolen tannophilus NRRL Y-2460]|uniref:Uncharacterized protein n=1 Tax=Pachysolen tannophilus NRRL Y-2460 TaxID=669874 RepID=A0A1E4TWC7_PACTA|nr:hypothetical protein PACTADRAFT_80161 [Pachysolen tannophilus NRRL Y-2460]